MSAEETVSVPRWALLAIVNGGRLCRVCTGYSPPWDGHDRNPPCEGRAREVIREALDA